MPVQDKTLQSNCKAIGTTPCTCRPNERVRKDRVNGRWYITMGHAGFNSRANNNRGYPDMFVALDAIRMYEKGGK